MITFVSAITFMMSYLFHSTHIWIHAFAGMTLLTQRFFASPKSLLSLSVGGQNPLTATAVTPVQAGGQPYFNEFISKYIGKGFVAQSKFR